MKNNELNKKIRIKLKNKNKIKKKKRSRINNFLKILKIIYY